jgi:hypothetical protein
MEKNTDTLTRPFFVSAATVAGNLVSVMDIAREISLAAKNANAIAERAGEKASGFRPITDYINEMGHETISLVNAINTKALEVSRIAVNELRSKETYERLVMAQNYSGENTPASIKKLITEASEVLSEQSNNLAKEKAQLIELLTEIKTQIRASAVISTCSKVEATRAEEHETSLEVVAKNVDAASSKISMIVKDCDDLLH